MSKIVVAAVLAVALLTAPGPAEVATTRIYPNVALSGGAQTGHLGDTWDLTACDIDLRFTYDATGLVDAFQSGAHAWSEFGMRAAGSRDFSPNGRGIWLATDHHLGENTLAPDPPGAPSLDLDDKLILQRAGGGDERSYDLPSTPPDPWSSHAVWFDRDGVDPWQAQMWGTMDGVTYNTGGVYEVQISLHATGPTSGQAYMTVNGEPQGFYIPSWHPGEVDIKKTGMTFSGDLTRMQVFYALLGRNATHNIAFRSISVDGCMVQNLHRVYLPHVAK